MVVLLKREEIAINKKAFRDYEVLERFEAGIALVGSEVKSLRGHKANFVDSFARIEEGEISLYNLDISSYAQASYLNVEPRRARRLLMHRREIQRIEGKILQRGLAIIPLRIYFNNRGLAKVELAIAKGKKTYDKREDIKKREINLAVRRAVRKE